MDPYKSVLIIILLVLATSCKSIGKFYVEGDERCGNGLIDPGETCDPPSSCPASCDDSDPCTENTMTGSPELCNAVCTIRAITLCAAGDGCCPAACGSSSDADCSQTCGDGTVDPGETCDPPASCPTDCEDGNLCTSDLLTGSADNCSARCAYSSITECGGADGCCPAGCDPSTDADCSQTCGDGTIDPGETCDPPASCPASCDDFNSCTSDTLTGSAANCNAACSTTPITSCASGDGCCPSGCASATDADCSASCGDGVIDPGETCDPPASCPASCSDGDPCTSDTMTGSAANCNAACSYPDITSCTAGDGCCPSGCTSATDADCSESCGNGLIDPGETCDPPASCPTSCGDGDPCTSDALSGSAANCNAACYYPDITSCTAGDGCCPPGCTSATDADCSESCGNGLIDPGETCDPPASCPTSCGDGDPCTSDTMTGSAANCNAACSYPAITSCTPGDGCCPSGCNPGNDSDCPPGCGNSYIDPGETCDPPASCPTSCDDSNSCTQDSMSGSASTCDVRCVNTPVTACTDGDGCCPTSCTPASDSDCSVDCRNDSTWPGDWAAWETEVVTLMNQRRAAGAVCNSVSYPAAGDLTMNAQLREAARCHSLDMATNDFFSHTGSDGSSFGQRCTTAGYSAWPMGENIAAGYNTPTATVAGWMSSTAGHCEMIMNGDANEVGVGYAYDSGSTYGDYWTADFGQR